MIHVCEFPSLFKFDLHSVRLYSSVFRCFCCIHRVAGLSKVNICGYCMHYTIPILCVHSRLLYWQIFSLWLICWLWVHVGWLCIYGKKFFPSTQIKVLSPYKIWKLYINYDIRTREATHSLCVYHLYCGFLQSYIYAHLPNFAEKNLYVKHMPPTLFDFGINMTVKLVP